MPRSHGRPRLSREERVFRVACAMWAEELRREHPNMTWDDVYRDIRWAPRHKKLLSQDAMYRLVRLRRHDPEGILEKATDKLTELRRERK